MRRSARRSPRPNATAAARHYHYDHAGSTVALSDDAGAVTGRASYSAYGVRLATSGNMSGTPFLWNGAYGAQTDPGGLVYMRARYYHPALGRFITQDPLGLAAGPNVYAYCDGDPVMRMDPSGLDYYLGGATEFSDFMARLQGGHMWAAVDLPDGRVMKFDFSSAANNQTLQVIDRMLATRSSPSKVKLEIIKRDDFLATKDSVYRFKQDERSDISIQINMLETYNRKPQYHLLTFNCKDASCTVVNRGDLIDWSPRPVATLNSLPKDNKLSEPNATNNQRCRK